MKLASTHQGSDSFKHLNRLDHSSRSWRLLSLQLLIVQSSLLCWGQREAEKQAAEQWADLDESEKQVYIAIAEGAATLC